MIVTHKKGFSMLTAIVVIVIMAVLTSYVMSISGKTIKITTDQYRKEQAIFYAKSYTEYAIMAVSARDRTVNCIDDIDGSIDGGATGNNIGYDVRIRIAYIGDANVGTCAGTRQFSTTVQNPNTSLNIIIDAYVDYRDLNNMSQTLTYHRRSLQKI